MHAFANCLMEICGMAKLNEDYIHAVAINTPLPVATRVNELAIHFTQAGWHCTQVAGNIVSFAKRKKFRWFLFFFLWLFAGFFALLGAVFFLVIPFIYVIYFFASADMARTVVLR